MDNFNELNKNLLDFDKELKKIGRLSKDKRDNELTIFKQKNKSVIDLINRINKIMNVDSSINKQTQPTMTY